MTKVITNFTTDLDFRRAINAAGGDLKIDSTPEQVVNSLRSIGGEASFGSPFETVLNIVNEDEPGPTPTTYDIDTDENNGVPYGEGTSEEFNGDVEDFIESFDSEYIERGFFKNLEGEPNNTFTPYTFITRGQNDTELTGTVTITLYEPDSPSWSENYAIAVLETEYGNYEVHIGIDEDTGSTLVYVEILDTEYTISVVNTNTSNPPYNNDSEDVAAAKELLSKLQTSYIVPNVTLVDKSTGIGYVGKAYRKWNYANNMIKFDCPQLGAGFGIYDIEGTDALAWDYIYPKTVNNDVTYDMTGVTGEDTGSRIEYEKEESLEVVQTFFSDVDAMSKTEWGSARRFNIAVNVSDGNSICAPYFDIVAEDVLELKLSTDGTNWDRKLQCWNITFSVDQQGNITVVKIDESEPITIKYIIYTQSEET